MRTGTILKHADDLANETQTRINEIEQEIEANDTKDQSQVDWLRNRESLREEKAMLISLKIALSKTLR